MNHGVLLFAGPPEHLFGDTVDDEAIQKLCTDKNSFHIILDKLSVEGVDELHDLLAGDQDFARLLVSTTAMYSGIEYVSEHLYLCRFEGDKIETDKEPPSRLDQRYIVKINLSRAIYVAVTLKKLINILRESVWHDPANYQICMDHDYVHFYCPNEIFKQRVIELIKSVVIDKMKIEVIFG